MPRDRSGVVVVFETEETSDLRLVLRDAAGAFIPIGSIVRLRESGESAPVGYDGVTYLARLAAENTIDITTQSGLACSASFRKTSQQDSTINITVTSCTSQK